MASSLQLRPLRVLLAEDDREMRRLLVSTLRKVACEVTEVGSGLQLWEAVSRGAVATATELPIDLIISDVRMPGKSGLDVLSGLRRNADVTPVILITAFGDNETHGEAYRLGALAVFNKPFELDDLCSVVVALREARDDYASGVQALAEASLQSTK